MDIGARLLALRNQRKLSQGEMAKRTGVLISHISRIERGRTVPTFETLERMARALDVRLYELFYQAPRNPPAPFRRNIADTWGSKGWELRQLEKFCRLFSRMEERDLKLLLSMAKKMASGTK